MPGKTGKNVVLIVDDEEAIGHMLAACCDIWGLEGIVASTATEAIAMIAECVPDVILTDFMMPGMNGHELLRTIHGNRRLQRIPSILMSAVPDVARRKSPADAFLPKPLDLDETRKALHFWLAQRRAGRRGRRP